MYGTWVTGRRSCIGVNLGNSYYTDEDLSKYRQPGNRRGTEAETTKATHEAKTETAAKGSASPSSSGGH